MDKEIFVVCDRNVETLAAGIAEGRPMLPITADEDHKTMDSVVRICRWLMEQGADRNAVVYAVGGGVTTDLVGFAASIYKRGVRYVNYPTTLLCQVDAGIGGKTGVNLDGYKNMIGVTRFPAATRILPEALKTLPARELRSGAAELLKTFIIEDNGNYDRAVKVLSAPVTDFDALHKLVLEAAEVKYRIVEQDPFEEGPRRKLNLGHTLAHAIEKCSNRMIHGEAVAVGTALIASAAVRLGVLKEEDRQRIVSVLTRLGFDLTPPVELKRLLKEVGKDKKSEDGLLRIVLPVGIGDCEVRPMTREAFAALFA